VERQEGSKQILNESVHASNKKRRRNVRIKEIWFICQIDEWGDRSGQRDGEGRSETALGPPCELSALLNSADRPRCYRLSGKSA
jgi:hypothetical protein